MCVKFYSENLNSGIYPTYPTNTYTRRITITLKMHDSTYTNIKGTRK